IRVRTVRHDKRGNEPERQVTPGSKKCRVQTSEIAIGPVDGDHKTSLWSPMSRRAPQVLHWMTGRPVATRRWLGPSGREVAGGRDDESKAAGGQRERRRADSEGQKRGQKYRENRRDERHVVAQLLPCIYVLFSSWPLLFIGSSGFGSAR